MECCPLPSSTMVVPTTHGPQLVSAAKLPCRGLELIANAVPLIPHEVVTFAGALFRSHCGLLGLSEVAVVDLVRHLQCECCGGRASI